MSLPRSAVLAAWTGAVIAGRADVADAVAAVTGDGEHDVVRAEVDETLLAATGLTLPDPAYLSDLLVLLRAAAETAPPTVRVAMPAPGDALGLPRATGLLGWACDAGEAVIIERIAIGPQPWGMALVPEVTEFGSELEPGVSVSWQVWTTEGEASGARPYDAPGSVAEADLGLRTALHDVTRTLERLEVAAWRPPDEDALAAITAAGQLPPLPSTLAGRSRAMLASAAQVLAIVAAAAAEPGGAVTGHQIGRRAQELTGAARAARRAIEAAVNFPA